MDSVDAQYEAYPYPQRDPADEARRLVIGSPSQLAEIEHYVFAGRMATDEPFRALIAGGGTGDAAIMLAQQLADRGLAHRVLYLDRSRASRAIAEARARVRGLTGLAFHTGDLAEAPGLGPFDYIDCCGVLHHLAAPEEGLRALAHALAPGGGIGLMVYGAFGRTGVYDLQAALRALAPESEPLERRIALARALLASLPATNRFRQNGLLGDHLQSDAGLVDLLLHARDRAYRVPALYALLAAAGLRLISFVPALRYDPALYLREPALCARAAALPAEERAAVAEALAGNMKKHVLYAAPAGSSAGTAALDPDAVPLLLAGTPAAYADLARRKGALAGTIDGLALAPTLPPDAARILAEIDGRRSFRAIHARLSPALAWPDFWRAAGETYRVFNGLNLMLLRRPARR